MFIKAATLLTTLFFIIQAPITPFSANATSIATVGSGTSVSCTETALKNAISQANTSTALSIQFNCGASPVSIAISSPISILGHTAVVLDGKNLISLDGQGRTRIIFVAAGGDLFLYNITLKNGVAPDPGGAIQVQMEGNLYLNNATFMNNKSNYVHTGTNTTCFGGGAIEYMGYNSASITNSQFISGNQAINGGAINIQMANMTISNTTFSGNTANRSQSSTDPCGGGGAIYVDGVMPSKSFRIASSSFSSNSTNLEGGAVFAHLYGTDSMSIDGSTFSSNTATYLAAKVDTTSGHGGAIWIDGEHTNQGRDFTGSVPITNSTFGQNHAEATGGAIYAADAPVILTNATLYGNNAANSYSPTNPYSHGNGGALSIQIAAGLAPSKLTNVTLADNSAGFSADAIEATGSISAAAVQLVNTIISNTLAQSSTVSGKMCTTKFTDLGGNFQSQARVSGTDCTPNISIVDPKLDRSLKDNGGPLMTVALQQDSPAEDHAVASACPNRDERGYIRSDACDSGAFEYDGQAFVAHAWVFAPFINR